MSGGDDTDPGWVRLAMTDASLVAELLVRLAHSRPPPPPSELAWSVRQRRTKPPPRNPAEDKKKGGRSSPTTPLSWSGATSSGGGGSEESPPLDSATRSKTNEGFGLPDLEGQNKKISSKLERSIERVNIRHGSVRMSAVRGPGSYFPRGLYLDRDRVMEKNLVRNFKVSMASASPVSATIGGKRPRKKKTLAELREEESLLLKERKNLRHELATLRLNFEKERSKNQRLKRIKIGMRPPVIPEQHERVQAPCVPSDCPEKRSGDGGAEVAVRPRFCNISEVKKVESRKRLELPDLNLPLEDGGCPDIPCAAA